MQKIILFYKFQPISDPTAICLWQKTLCQSLDLRGRIILSTHGINAVLGGETKDLKTYAKETKAYFKDTQFKWSEGGREDFPRLSVKVREEIVTFGAAKELKVNNLGIVDGGKHLSPTAVHDLIKTKGDNQVVFFDGRSKYEANIGKFKNAVTPNIRTAKDFTHELDSGKYDDLKEKTVVTYCTGGIRCEILTVLMKNRGFKDVYQLDGGIIKYGEKYGDEGLWEGSLYVFDGRMGVKFSDKAIDIGICSYCQGKTSRYINCANLACNDLILVCVNCDQKTYCQNCASVTTV